MFLAVFCLRLACGMIAAVLVLSPDQVNPRFYRVQFLTALGLTALAAALLYDVAGPWLWAALGGSLVLTFLGSFAWSLNGAPGGRIAIPPTALALAATLGLATVGQVPEDGSLAWSLAGELSSAALLGTAVTAMLMGHSYLIAPAMSLSPLRRLLAALFAAVGVRMAIAAVSLSSWTRGHSLGNLDEVTLALPLRWGFGFVGPLVLGWMAWQAARIRSTQSATGILYVAVIFCFLGELIGQLLLGMTGSLL